MKSGFSMFLYLLFSASLHFDFSLLLSETIMCNIIKFRVKISLQSTHQRKCG